MWKKVVVFLLFSAVVVSSRSARKKREANAYPAPIPCPLCFVDPCSVNGCPAWPTAKCVQDPCSCTASWYVEGYKVDCDCKQGINYCKDPCYGAKCPAYPKATCAPYYCGTCEAVWFQDGKKVDCTKCNEICTKEYRPVCGTDGQTYGNQCMLEVANCKNLVAGGKGITKDYDGKCCGEEGCPDIWKPVCGSDGKTYSNDCDLGVADCESKRRGGYGVTKVHEGKCCSINRCPLLLVCQPICGSDGKTYCSECELENADCYARRRNEAPVTKKYDGNCCNPDEPKVCPADYQPSCGTDGKTYPSMCDLEKADCKHRQAGGKGIKKAYDGPCNTYGRR